MTNAVAEKAEDGVEPLDTSEMEESPEVMAPIARPLAAWQERARAWGYTDDQIAAAAVVEGERYAPHRAWDPESECGGALRVQDKHGHAWDLLCDVCRIEVSVNMRTADPERLLAERLAEAGIPEMFLGVEFDKAEPAQQETARACREWVKAFRREPLPAIALWGAPGRGKSHLLSLMVETLIRRYGGRAMYRSAIGLLDELTEGFDGGEYEKRWQRLLEVPVLALDDLGAERMTDWRRERLQELVDSRYRNGRPLLVASNLPPKRWDEEFGERTASRLRGMALPFQLGGPDRRETAQQSLLSGDG